jgi:cell division transport system permease protein
MNWLYAHGKACRQALARLAVLPVNTLLAALAIGIALALPAGGYLLLGQIGALGAPVGQDGKHAALTPQLTLFFHVDAPRSAVDAVDRRLRALPEVRTTQLLTREETLQRMQATAGLGDVLEALPRNPFPDALIVTPATDAPAALDSLAAQARQWPEVEQVHVDANWAQRLAALLHLAHTGLQVLAVLLGLGLVTITFNTIRLQLLTRRSEIELSQLLGATDAFIRRPFLWYGSLLGLFGGCVAWLIVAAMVFWLRLPLGEMAALYGFQLTLGLLGPDDSAVLLGSAAALGWLGAVLSLRQYLR